MTYYPQALTKEEARSLQQRDNTEVNFKRIWKLKQHPCTDCGLLWHPHAMTFDHRDRKGLKYKTTKTGMKKPVSIGECLYWNPVAFNTQLKLMDVVCRNCHMIREAKRDINDPKVSPRNKHLFPMWFEKCDGALIKGQSDTTQAVTAALKRVDEALPEKKRGQLIGTDSGAMFIAEIEQARRDGSNAAIDQAHQAITNELSKFKEAE